MRRAYLLWLLLGVLPAASCKADTPVAAPAGPTPLPIVSGVEVSEVDALWQSVPWEVNRYDGHIVIRSERATDYDQHELISLTFMDQAEPALVEAVAVVDSMGSAQRYTLKPSAIRLALFKYRGGIVAGDLIDALNRRVAFWVDVVNPLTVRNEGAEPSSSFELASGVVVQWRETQLQLLTGGDCTRAPIYLHAFDGPFGMEHSSTEIPQSRNWCASGRVVVHTRRHDLSLHVLGHDRLHGRHAAGDGDGDREPVRPPVDVTLGCLCICAISTIGGCQPDRPPYHRTYVRFS